MGTDPRSRLFGASIATAIYVLVLLAVLWSPKGGTTQKNKGREIATFTLFPVPDTSALTAEDSVSDDALRASVDHDKPAATISETQPKPLPIAEPNSTLAGSGNGQRASTRDGDHVPTGDEAMFFQRILLVHIARFQRYPERARHGHVQGVVLIRFTMDREGQVQEIWIDRSSGYSFFDEEALATVRRAQPLPMIPTNLPSSLDVILPVTFEAG